MLRRLLLHTRLFVCVSYTKRHSNPVIKARVSVYLLTLRKYGENFPSRRCLCRLTQYCSRFILPPCALPERIAREIMVNCLIRLLFRNTIYRIRATSRFDILVLLRVIISNIIIPWQVILPTRTCCTNVKSATIRCNNGRFFLVFRLFPSSPTCPITKRRDSLISRNFFGEICVNVRISIRMRIYPIVRYNGRTYRI